MLVALIFGSLGNKSGKTKKLVLAAILFAISHQTAKSTKVKCVPNFPDVQYPPVQTSEKKEDLIFVAN